eukprot:1923370-Rhodomonas_salina.3
MLVLRSRNSTDLRVCVCVSHTRFRPRKVVDGIGRKPSKILLSVKRQQRTHPLTSHEMSDTISTGLRTSSSRLAAAQPPSAPIMHSERV